EKPGANHLDWLVGPAKVNAVLLGRRVHFESGTVKADLTGTSFSLRQINWEKPAGTAASLSADLAFGENSALSLSNIDVAGQGFSVKGEMNFDAKDVRRANFNSILIGKTNNFGFTRYTANRSSNHIHWP